ncbi:MAG TPA: hypothetical protein VEB21_16115 [Terriglobales bacterium]|nr:hypothetical protein [Terriglobales bacterium]
MRNFIRSCSLCAALGALLYAPASFAGSAVEVEEKHTTVEKRTTSSPSGVIVVEDPSSRTFKLQGHTQVYTAPSDVDLNTYSGKEVTLVVGPDGKVTKIEKKTTTMP